jgi:DNA-directed RNA polymerase specialized sigma24 family protein
MNLTDLQLEKFYREHFAALMEMAVSRFKLSEADAGDLVADILMASILQLPRIEDPKVWFAGALTVAVQRRAARVE